MSSLNRSCFSANTSFSLLRILQHQLDGSAKETGWAGRIGVQRGEGPEAQQTAARDGVGERSKRHGGREAGEEEKRLRQKIAGARQSNRQGGGRRVRASCSGVKGRYSRSSPPRSASRQGSLPRMKGRPKLPWGKLTARGTCEVNHRRRQSEPAKAKPPGSKACR